MTTIALLAIHGMGRTSRCFADGFFSDVKRRLERHDVIHSDDLLCEPVYYQDVFQERQEAIWKDMTAAEDLDWTRLRREPLRIGCGSRRF